MKAGWFVSAIGLVVVALLSAPGPAAAFCVIVEPPTPLPTQVNGTQVEIQLTEGFARVVIIKEFYNPSDQPKQGQIAFPLEKGHELITDLRLKIGNVTYGSSTQNRTDALNAFLEAIAKGQDAALVQYDAPRDVYWIAVTIPPKEARTTITTLEMPLTKTDGFYDSGYRLSIDARERVSYLRVHVLSPTDAPRSPHPPRRVRKHGLPRSLGSRERRRPTDRQRSGPGRVVRSRGVPWRHRHDVFPHAAKMDARDGGRPRSLPRLVPTPREYGSRHTAGSGRFLGHRCSRDGPAADRGPHIRRATDAVPP